MFLDEDRDGNVDADPAQSARWEWGEGKKGKPLGTIILVRTRYDFAERQRLILAWHDGKRREHPENWEASLSITQNPQKIRIFLDQTGEKKCLLGMGESTTVNIHNYDYFQKKLKEEGWVELWMEAIDYPQEPDGSDACIELQLIFTDLRFKDPDHKTTEQKVQLRIAPWIMASDLDETEKLYILDFTRQLNVKNGNYKVQNTELRSDLQRMTSGTAQLQPAALASMRRYIRDVMRFGTHTAPTDFCSRVVLRGNNMKTTYKMAKEGIDLGSDYIGYIEVGDPFETDLETGGNMVVSPPTPKFPFGRIICGSIGKGGLPQWERFLYAQRIQAPLKIDTSWLDVGHSDEIVAFVPNVKSGGFKMLLASPRQAYKILCRKDAWDFAKLAARKEALGPKNQKIEADARWEKEVREAASGAAPIDFRRLAKDKGLNIDPRMGHGRLAFNRYNNALRSEERWVQDFLLEDPLLKKLVADIHLDPSVDIYRSVCIMEFSVTEVFNRLGSPTLADPATPSIARIQEMFLDYYQVQEAGIGEIWGLLLTNLILQVKLDKICAFLCKELDTKLADIITVPMLYHDANNARTLVGDMINLVQLNKPKGGNVSDGSNGCKCIVPKPYGPISGGADLFEEDFNDQLGAIGINVEFIDEWYEYHLDGGEIHCGTNQLPKTVPKKWWEVEPPRIDGEVLQWPNGRVKDRATLKVRLQGKDGLNINWGEGFSADMELGLPVEGFAIDVNALDLQTLIIGDHIGEIAGEESQSVVMISSIKNHNYVKRDRLERYNLSFAAGGPDDATVVATVTKPQDADDQGPPPPMDGENPIPDAPPPMDDKK
jgi:hypothetical protein